MSVEGEPQPYRMLKNYSKTESLNRNYQKLNKVQWELHVSELKQLSVLANHAMEFEKNKYRIERKNEILQPDLITSKTIQKTLYDSKVKSSDKEVPLKTIVLDDSLSIINTGNELATKEKHKSIIPIKSFQDPSEKFEACSTSINIVSPLVRRTARKSLRRTEKGRMIEQAKPPNILVYSDSSITKANVISTLRTVLEKNVYTIYPLATKDVKNKVWIDNTTLLVICGNVPKEVGKIFLDYFLHGGKMFCLCSDVLHIILPNYRIAEVSFFIIFTIY